MSQHTKFLACVAKELKLTPKPTKVFEIFFDFSHRDQTPEFLVSKIWGEVGYEPEKKLNAGMTKIYEALEEQYQCGFVGKRGKPSLYHDWLWQTYFPLWKARQPFFHPFGDRGPIEDPARFFGRTNLLSDIRGEVAKGASIVLVGESGIGKSSILRYLCADRSEAGKSVEAQYIYWNLQPIGCDEELLAGFCDKLELQSIHSWPDLADQLISRGKVPGWVRQVVCLDEIARLSNDGFTPAAYWGLCTLTELEGRPIVLVATSRCPMIELFPVKSEQDSPLHNKLEQIPVEPFSPKEAMAFIQNRLSPTGIELSPEQLAEVYQDSSGHPDRLQRAAAKHFDRLRNFDHHPEFEP